MIGAPLMRLFRKLFKRNTAAILTLVSFTLLFLVLLWIFIPPVVQQARNLANVDYDELVATVEKPLNDWNNWLIDKGLIEKEIEDQSTDDIEKKDRDKIVYTDIIRLDSMLQEHSDSIKLSPLAVVIKIDQSALNNDKNRSELSEIQDSDSFFERFRKNVYKFLNPSVIPRFFGRIGGFFGNFLIAFMSISFIAFFFLREQGLFVHMLSSIVPNEWEEQVVHAVDQTSNLLIRYFVGIALQITLITLFVSIALGIMGVKNALLVGFFVALMNLIPYIGPIIGAVFGVIITISSNLDLSFAQMFPLLLTVVVVIGIMQLLDNFILQPNIFSKSVKAHPLEIFIVILIAANLGGVLGMLIAIPVYTVLRVVAKVFFSEFKIVQRITKSI